MGGIESAVYQASGSMPILSTQQIISCDKTDAGCNGGDLPTAFDYVESAGGLDTEEDYPYTSKTGRSGSCKSSTPVVKVTDYKYAVAPCQGGSCSISSIAFLIDFFVVFILSLNSFPC